MGTVVDCFMRILEASDLASGEAAAGGSKAKFWTDTTKLLLHYTLPLLYVANGDITVDSIIDFAMSVPIKQEQLDDEKFILGSYAMQTQEKAATAPAVPIGDDALKRLLRFWSTQFQRIPERTRGNILISLSSRLDRSAFRRQKSDSMQGRDTTTVKLRGANARRASFLLQMTTPLLPYASQPRCLSERDRARPGGRAASFRRRLLDGLAPVLAAAALAACGGGGGDDGGAPASGSAASGAQQGAAADSANGTASNGSGATAASGTGSTTATTPVLDSANVATANLDAFARSAVDGINAIRNQSRACDSSKPNEISPAVGAISWNTKLAASAFDHVKDMQARNVVDHLSANGGSVGQRVTAQGYPWRIVGENLGAGFPSIDALLQYWSGSASHCKVLMEADFAEIGLARVDGTSANSYANYWTLDLAQARP